MAMQNNTSYYHSIGEKNVILREFLLSNLQYEMTVQISQNTKNLSKKARTPQ